VSLGWIIDGRACAIHCADPRWITVPAGYRTDFASIPHPMTRLVWPLLPPVGRSGKAAVIHDWLCGEQPHSVDHKMAADIINEAMTVLRESAPVGHAFQSFMSALPVTDYFRDNVLVKRPYIRLEWCEAAVRDPIRDLHNAFPDRRFKPSNSTTMQQPTPSTFISVSESQQIPPSDQTFHTTVTCPHPTQGDSIPSLSVQTRTQTATQAASPTAAHNPTPPPCPQTDRAGR